MIQHNYGGATSSASGQVKPGGMMDMDVEPGSAASASGKRKLDLDQYEYNAANEMTRRRIDQRVAATRNQGESQGENQGGVILNYWEEDLLKLDDITGVQNMEHIMQGVTLKNV